MKTIYCALPILIVLLPTGCGTVERTLTPTEETAIIACEAAHVTILTPTIEGHESTREPIRGE